jgi:hypothetical protein
VSHITLRPVWPPSTISFGIDGATALSSSRISRSVFTQTKVVGIMLKLRLTLVCFGIAAMFTPCLILRAQTANAVPAAPLPSQIFTAKKVFISNAGVGAKKNYDAFYAGIKSWGQYELVSAPEDADLVLEISISSQLTNVGGTKESGPMSSRSSWFRLVLLDPRRHIALWTLEENIEPYVFQKTGQKHLDDAIKRLVGSLKDLTVQSAAAAK